MSISKKEIKNIAHLARLELNDIEVDKYQEQLSSILKHVDVLKEADCSDLDILGLSSEEVNKTREDSASNWSKDEVKLALKQSKEIEDGQVKVRRVL